MRTILSFFIILFLLGGYVTDVLNAAPPVSCTWRYKWVWDGTSYGSCTLFSGCGTNNGRKQRIAKCVREDGNSGSTGELATNCATWDPYTGAKSLIETYEYNCTVPCNAICGTSHTTYTASQPANTNLCDANTTYSTGFTWTDTTAVTAWPTPAYSYKWNCASKNGGLSASCYAYKPTTGSCGSPSASTSYPTSSECSIGGVNWTGGDWNGTDGTYNWYCNGVNTGGSSGWCSSYKIRTGQACTPKIANSDWNTASSISQTYNGSSWLPTLTSSYNTTASSSECRYKCSVGKTWSGVTSTCN